MERGVYKDHLCDGEKHRLQKAKTGWVMKGEGIKLGGDGYVRGDALRSLKVKVNGGTDAFRRWCCVFLPVMQRVGTT